MPKTSVPQSGPQSMHDGAELTGSALERGPPSTSARGSGAARLGPPPAGAVCRRYQTLSGLLADRNLPDASSDREAAESLGRRERREKLPYADTRGDVKENLTREAARLEQMEPPGTAARREREIADQLLAARSAQALAAARIEPSPTSSKSWASGPPTGRRRRLGIAASGSSRATGSIEASKTPAAPSVASGRAALSMPRRRPRGDGLPRPSAGLALSSSWPAGRRPGASSGASGSVG